MDKFIITGGKKLTGEVTIAGAKNAAVAIIPAALLVNGISIIENVPQITDVSIICNILEHLGAKIEYLDETTLKIDCTQLNSYVAPKDMVGRMRASYYLIGALLGRFNHAVVDMPGGCNFGERPIDQHIKGFEALGATVNIEKDPDTDGGTIETHADKLTAPHKLNPNDKGGIILMDVVSVGATINTILAAVRAKGTTIIDNAAKEPHVVDLANFLNAMGADIKGAGTEKIRITGKEELKGGTYTIIPDQIEAGTFMIAAAATGGNVLIKNVIPKHLECISAKLLEMNVNVEEYDDSIRVWRDKPLKKANIKTMPHPGFPTDMQPQAVSLLSLAQGTSVITEGVWENRFQYIDELRKMGVNVDVDGRTATIKGVEHLNGAKVDATDLRAGACLVIAALAAQGVSEIGNLKYIDRGYEKFEEKLKALGADIERITVN